MGILLTTLVTCWVTATKTELFLHYHFQQIGFPTTFDFFKTYTTYPGGIADYLAEFISQLFSFNLFGSFLIAAIVALQGLIALDLVTRMTGKSKLGYSVFSPVVLSGVIIVSELPISLLYKYPATIGIYIHMGLLHII